MRNSNRYTMQLVSLFAALLTCGYADAATVTYTFDEAGWVNTAGTAEDFAGSFSGTVEGNGTVGLADLSGFTAIVTETNAQNETKPIANFGLSGSGSLTSFLFDITTNTLSLGGTGSPGATICLGDAVAQGVCGPLGPRPVSRTGVPEPPPEGIFLSSVNGTLDATTIANPTITLQAGINGSGSPVPAPTATPEPGSMLLCGGALVFVSLGMRASRKEKRSR